jgi:ABC-type sugar transport system substrate-binding protein
MASLQIFAQQMNALAATVSQRVPQLTKEVAQHIVEDVARENPVLTGQSAANWKTAIGAPDTSWDQGPNPQAGQHSIDSAKAALVSLAMGQTVYITNNVPYIVDLNSGSSAKAPAGFVETAIVDALHRTANFNLLIK